MDTISELKRLREVLDDKNTDMSTPKKIASVLKGFGCVSEISVEDYIERSCVEFKLVDQNYAVSFRVDENGNTKKWIKELVEKKIESIY